jgi:hypothetical protein
MAEVIPKNHNFLPFKKFLETIRQVVKFRQIKTSDSGD